MIELYDMGGFSGVQNQKDRYPAYVFGDEILSRSLNIFPQHYFMCISLI